MEECMSISEQLIILNDIKIGCKEEINKKGVKVTETDSFTLYPEKISEIKQEVVVIIKTEPTPQPIIQPITRTNCTNYDKHNKNSLSNWSCEKKMFHYGGR